MNKLTIDLETRSRTKLTGPKVARGLYPYAEDPSTDVLCVALKWNDEPVKLFVPSEKWIKLLAATVTGKMWIADGTLLTWDQVADMVNRADIIEAHNVNFERQLWFHVVHRRYGLPDLPRIKLRCSAAKAATVAIPRDLLGACNVMGTEVKKDEEGKRVMMKMCKPRTPTKNNPSEWHEDPSDFAKLCRYCMTDVDAEHSLSEKLPEMPEYEQALFLLDMAINERGIYCDLEAIDKATAMVTQNEGNLLPEIQAITRGQVTSTRQTEEFRQWAWRQGLKLPDLKKYTLEDALKEELPAYLHRAVEIRQALSMTSVSKADTMKRWACSDRRIRGAMMYHGASTGRWAGKGIQPQNYPRNAFNDEEFEEFISSDLQWVNMLYGSAQLAASRALRGMLCAAPGNSLLCADYSGIESRVLAWLACDEDKMNVFRTGKDPYLYAASAIYGKSYEDLEAAKKEGKCPERKIGKVVELASGYQGWVGAFASMADNYGIVVPEEEAKKAVSAWRDKHPSIVAFWHGLMAAAVNTVKSGKEHSYGRIKFLIKDRWLCMRLPSGRLLYYYDPYTYQAEDKYGRLRDTISFWGYKTDKDGGVKQWQQLHLYGGLLAENATQAVARDILVNGMFHVEQSGYPIVMHVHDEAVAEIPTPADPEYHIKEFERLLCVLPAWAEGLPLSAEGWCGRRYRK